jgi:CRP/FNR family cyclic AMP-dependent transcriptional regulator
MATANAGHGLRIFEADSAFSAPKRRASSALSRGSSKALDVITSPVTYPKGAVLFVEGQAAHGIFAVYSGRVKLSTCSFDGKAIILKIAEAGELVGLPATLSGKPYEVTAEVSEPARVNFIRRAAFLEFLRGNGEAVVNVARLLAISYYEGHRLIQSLGHARSASEKLARFFIDWSAHHARGQDRLCITLTHQEIGEMIGISRETVSRQLSALKKRNLLTVRGATVTIRNRVALQGLASI